MYTAGRASHKSSNGSRERSAASTATREYALFAKAGTGAGVNAVNWWIGWVERRGRAEAFFAVNLTPGKHTLFADRFVIARAILAAEGYVPSESPPA